MLDNYCIHDSRQTRAWLKKHGSKVRLRFLPPYCPDDNRIERCVWRKRGKKSADQEQFA